MITAEQPRNCAQLARRDQLAHPRRADDLTFDRDRSDHDSLKAHLPPQLGHHLGIASASVAETDAMPHHYFARADPAEQVVAHEFGGRELAERGSKRDYDYAIDSRCAQ